MNDKPRESKQMCVLRQKRSIHNPLSGQRRNPWQTGLKLNEPKNIIDPTEVSARMFHYSNNNRRCDATGHQAQSDEGHRIAEDGAGKLGFGIFLDAFPIGTDEPTDLFESPNPFD